MIPLGCPGQILTFEGGPDGFAEKVVLLGLACSHNPSGCCSHDSHLLGVLWLLRNGDTFSDKVGEVPTPIAEKCRGHRRVVSSSRANRPRAA